MWYEINVVYVQQNEISAFLSTVNVSSSRRDEQGTH